LAKYRQAVRQLSHRCFGQLDIGFVRSEKMQPNKRMQSDHQKATPFVDR